jgi:hypothetical protein
VEVEIGGGVEGGKGMETVAAVFVTVVIGCAFWAFANTILLIMIAKEATCHDKSIF